MTDAIIASTFGSHLRAAADGRLLLSGCTRDGLCICSLRRGRLLLWRHRTRRLDANALTQCAVARCMAWQLRTCLLPLMAAAPTAAARVSARCQRASSMRCCTSHGVAALHSLAAIDGCFLLGGQLRTGREEGRTDVPLTSGAQSEPPHPSQVNIWCRLPCRQAVRKTEWTHAFAKMDFARRSYLDAVPFGARAATRWQTPARATFHFGSRRMGQRSEITGHGASIRHPRQDGWAFQVLPSGRRGVGFVS